MPRYQKDNVNSNGLRSGLNLFKRIAFKKGLDSWMPQYQKDNVNFNGLHSGLN